MSLIRSQLPSQKYKSSKKFQILSEYKVENEFQYPDMQTLTEMTFSEL